MAKPTASSSAPSAMETDQHFFFPTAAAPMPHRFPSPANVAPPCFTVDLSLPPEKRYTHIAPAFASELAILPALFTEVLGDLLPGRLASGVARLSPFFLRNVYDKEETRELAGISKASGVPMYLLVAFNVLLDLFMGCTSGGVRVRDPDGDRPGLEKMLHFRALDWGMDPLRRLVMEVSFVRKPNEPVLGTSVTYFGYVGVLTGVRKGLSMSLNFRPHHDGSSARRQLGYGAHLLLVLLGYRRSISSVLRGYLLSKNDKTMGLDNLVAELADQKSTAAYLIFCDAKEIVSMEKDNGSATFERSDNFLVTMNHDVADEASPEDLVNAAKSEPGTMAATGMENLVSSSLERKSCAVELWALTMRRRKRHRLPETPLEEEDVIGWMEGDRIVNGETHYGVIMDPATGRILWLQRWQTPLPEEGEATFAAVCSARRISQRQHERAAIEASTRHMQTQEQLKEADWQSMQSSAIDKAA